VAAPNGSDKRLDNAEGGHRDALEGVEAGGVGADEGLVAIAGVLETSSTTSSRLLLQS
jgi:hypothetical protein